MTIDLTEKEFRRLLDLVYIGNWILNSARGEDRFEDYDLLQEKLFSLCAGQGMPTLIQRWRGHIFPSRAYEDAVFYDILAEELARRDLGLVETDPEDFTELNARMDEYLDEFDRSGLDAVTVDLQEG